MLLVYHLGGGIWAFEKSYIPVIEDFGRGKTVIGPKTLGTTDLEFIQISL